jgi:DNA-binding NtrC family response regulator
MTSLPQILVVDDDRYDHDRYCQLLRRAGYMVEGALNAEQAQTMVEQKRFDVVLLDMLLPLRVQGRSEFGGLELLRRIKILDTATQVIAVTGYGSRELAVDAMREGAFDYITKDLDTEDRLPGSVRAGVARAQLLRAAAAKSVDSESDVELTTPSNLIADSAAMRQALRRAQRLADIDAPLLIVGEPGVGKELFASLMHLNSRYAGGPLVVVICRTFSNNLVELWGDVAHTKPGLCAQAEGGTLVLKGIQDLPYNQQKQLVSLIKERQYRPIGAMSDIRCNIRVIATTTGDLERLVRQKRFWKALYDELSIATIDVPPLRERRDKDDITAIAGYLLHRYGLAAGISSEANELLVTYDYTQGNIKELEDILRDAAAQADGNIIQAEHLSAKLHSVKSSIEPAEQRTALQDEAVVLSMRFVPGVPALILWESLSSGNTRSSLHVPFGERELPLVLRALDAVQWPDQTPRRPQFDSSEQALLTNWGLWDGNGVAADIDQRIGRLLYQALISDSTARSALDNARNVAVNSGQPVTFVWRFPPEAVALAALPWELLWDDRQPLLLSRARLSSCIRYIDLPQALPPAPRIGTKLRLLAVCPAQGIPDSLHAEEQAQRERALNPLIDAGLLAVDELRPVNLSDLTDRLQDERNPVDILHFYGHGVWREGTGHLSLDNGEISASQLAALVGDIPLVVLHACRSGTVGSDDLFTGIAPMLSAEGVATVVAMQFTVSVAAANRFSAVLYRNLAQGESLQMAVAKARQALYVEYRKSWYVPVVYIRAREVKPVYLLRK